MFIRARGHYWYYYAHMYARHVSRGPRAESSVDLHIHAEYVHVQLDYCLLRIHRNSKPHNMKKMIHIKYIIPTQVIAKLSAFVACARKSSNRIRMLCDRILFLYLIQMKRNNHLLKLNMLSLLLAIPTLRLRSESRKSSAPIN